MAKKGTGKSRSEERTTIKLPAPQSEMEKMQARLEAMGADPAYFKLFSVEKGSGGKGLEIEMSVTLPEPAAERFLRELTIKPFDPDPHASGKPVTKVIAVEEVREPEPTVKLWTGKERGKRSKPKSDGPDFP